MIASVYGTVPPVENNIIDEVKVAVHTYRTIPADVGSKKITAEHTVMPTDGCTESMIVGIQCFRENRILDGNVYRRKFQPVSICPSVVYMTVDRHVFIQSPTGGAMVNHDISNRIPSYCIITESYVLRTATEAHVANHDIVCIDQERLSGDADTISGSCLSGNRYIRGTYANRAFQTNHSRYIEYNNTCTSRFAGFA